MKAKDLAPKDLFFTRRGDWDASNVLTMPEEDLVQHLVVSADRERRSGQMLVHTVCESEQLKLELYYSQIVIVIDGGNGDPYR